MHHHPSSPLSRLADALHRAYVRLFGDRGTSPTARRFYRARPARLGLPRMAMAGGIVKRLRDDRALRAECERMADLLGGLRRGSRDAQHVTMRAALKRETCRAMHSVRQRTLPARQRFAGGAAAMRHAARETAAVAASTARRLGARHRHVPGTTDVQHDFVRKLIEYGKNYERTRARGERSVWQQGRGSLAW